MDSVDADFGWTIPATERAYLRELANRQAGYAALPLMEQRARMWRDLNDGRPGAMPLISVYTKHLDRDFMPRSIYRCASRTGRVIEEQLLRNIRNHELIDDDKAVPGTFDIDWFVDINEFGVKVDCEMIKDGEGVETGFRYHHPIVDLKRDFHILKPADCRVDRERTLGWKAFLDELLGDILPARIQIRVFPDLFVGTMLTMRVIELMGMEAFFVAMSDSPDEVHGLMAYLRDNALRVMRWAEGEGLLVLNNGNQEDGWASYNFTTRLPAPDHVGGPVRLCDLWGYSNSQETVGVSAGMFSEFCFPYYRDVCEPMGLLYWGCCEPVHPFWEDIRRMPHLRKLSISRWCDQRFMGEALRGTGIVFSRKPDPNLLGVGVNLDEGAWAAHIRETLDAAKGVNVEFIIIDVYTLHGNIGKLHRAIEIARREIDRHGGMMSSSRAEDPGYST